MDRIAFELGSQCARVDQRERYDKKNSERRTKRLKRSHLLFPDLLLCGRHAHVVHEQRPLMEIDSVPLLDNDDDHPDESLTDVHPDESLIDDHHCSAEETDNRQASSISQEALCDVDSMCSNESVLVDCSEPAQTRLHQHTATSTLDYCETFTKLARRSNLSKSHTNDFLFFIQSGLPVPNHMPTTEKKLLDLLEVKDLFTKRSVCVPCRRELDYQQITCSQCHSSERTSIAHV